MRIKVREFEVEIGRHAVVQTSLGFAGYVEATLPDGTKVRFAGRWDNPYNQTETEPAHVAEVIWVDGEFVPWEDPPDENGHTFLIGDDGLTTEEIVQAVAKEIGL